MPILCTQVAAQLQEMQEKGEDPLSSGLWQQVSQVRACAVGGPLVLERLYFSSWVGHKCECGLRVRSKISMRLHQGKQRGPCWETGIPVASSSGLLTCYKRCHFMLHAASYFLSWHRKWALALIISVAGCVPSRHRGSSAGSSWPTSLPWPPTRRLSLETGRRISPTGF